MQTAAIEKRVKALEAEVALLKQALGLQAKSEAPWWEQIAGTFAKDPLYKKAMRFGRQYRRSLRPTKPRRARRGHGGPRHRSP